MPQDKAYRQAYYQKNKEKAKAYRKVYNQSPAAKKSFLLYKWKIRGLIHDDYDDLYDKYLNATCCENCECEFGIMGDKSGTYKCMDHDHETGLFRNFLCVSCNNKRH